LGNTTWWICQAKPGKNRKFADKSVQLTLKCFLTGCCNKRAAIKTNPPGHVIKANFVDFFAIIY